MLVLEAHARNLRAMQCQIVEFMQNARVAKRDGQPAYAVTAWVKLARRTNRYIRRTIRDLTD